MPWEFRKKKKNTSGDWDCSLSSSSSSTTSSTMSLPTLCPSSSATPSSSPATMLGARLVKRLKNTNPDKFTTMVKMHLSFLLDLPGSSLEEFLGDDHISSGNGDGNGGSGCHGSGSNGNTPTEKPTPKSGGIFSNLVGKRKHNNKDSKPATPESGVFGIPLAADVIEHVYPLVEFLSQPKNLKEEGLFRKSGHLGRQRLLREKLQNGDDLHGQLDGSEFTAHDCAGVFKSFLADLPEPLLTDKHYLAYCQLPGMCSVTKQLSTVQLLLQLMPKAHFVLLECVLELLHKVASEEANKMTAEALGMLFAPTILAPRKMIAKDLHCVSTNINHVVAFMVDKAKEVTKVPEALVTDIKSYWDEMDEVPTPMPGSGKYTDEVDGMRRFRKRIVTASDHAITTTVTFTDRQASQQAAASTDTETSLAQLYAHVSAMPESTKKRKLLKQFNKANGGLSMGTPITPTSSEKHKRTKSLGQSIKKMVGRSGASAQHKRRGSGHAAQVQTLAQQTPCRFSSPSPAIIKRPPVTTPCHTPVKKLFTDRLKTTDTSTYTQKLPSSATNSPRVHIVDMSKPTTPSSSSISGKRKAPGVDSPMLSAAATQTSLTMLSNFMAATAAAASTCNHQDDEEDKENGLPSCSARVQHKQQTAVSSSSSFMCCSPSEAVAASAHRQYPGAKRCALVTASTACDFSPISKSVTMAPKSVQQSVATPGSRQPMVLLHTP